jgi:hypothetical protein
MAEEKKGVKSTHPMYDEYAPRWVLTKNVVKSHVKEYIKDVEDVSSSTEHMAPLPEHASQEEKDRYAFHWNRITREGSCRNQRYKDDAQFINFTARHKNFLVGAIFRKPIQTTLPPLIDYINVDITGSGISLQKLAQEVAGELMQTGRYGLLVDYPPAPDGLTLQEVEAFNLKARVSKYPAESIINWQTENLYGVERLTLVVLMEQASEIDPEDGFKWVGVTRYRVLRLVDGVYTQMTFNGDGEKTDEFTPKDKAGNTWNEIPFTFVGSEDNDADIDGSPLYDIAMVNIGHLRNSADFEESIHICGSPTLIISTEMSPQEFNVANPDGVKIGARRGHNLGANSSAMFLQPDPNQLVDVAMKRKEEQIVMMGVRPLVLGGTNETAEGVRLRLTGETCELTILSLNIQQALIQCAKWLNRFMNEAWESDDIIIKVNTDFVGLKLDAQEKQVLIQMYNNGVIAKKDLRLLLRENGDLPTLVERTDEAIDEDVANDVTNVDPLEG